MSTNQLFTYISAQYLILEVGNTIKGILIIQIYNRFY